VTVRYTNSRVRGLAPWRPQAKTLALLEAVNAVLEEYDDYLPMTLRQIFYRLVGAYDYDKSEQAYERLGETLNRARRAGLVPFEAIRDDGGVAILGSQFGFSGEPHFWRYCQMCAATYRRNRSLMLDLAIELWVEATGMAEQFRWAAVEYGVDVHSSGGFNSLTEKHAAAERARRRELPTLVLHVGDHDPSGVSIFDSAVDDVETMIGDLGGDVSNFTARRVVVTPEQISRHGLPTAPAKKNDVRGVWTGETVQAEALPPDTLHSEVRAELEQVPSVAALADLHDVERDEQDRIVDLLDTLIDRSPEAQ